MNAQKNPFISIIIPTLNEAAYLPKLLQSIAGQTFQSFEVIVADAGSSDTTRQITQEAGYRVVPGGLPGAGRNAGAAAAQGEYLLFLDADVILPATFLERAITEFDAQYFEIATFGAKPISKLRVDRLYYQVRRALMATLQDLYPFTSGAAILVTRRLHRRIGGFNESMQLAEDNDYGTEGKKIARLGSITSTYIWLSMRRLDKEGRLKLIDQYVRFGVLRLLEPLGVKQTVRYEFGNFRQLNSLSSAEQLLEDLLAVLEPITLASNGDSEPELPAQEKRPAYHRS